MPPSLPSRPMKNPDKLSVSWICKLLDCVEYAMKNPRGDGKTIINESSGTLRALRQPSSGTGSAGGGSCCVPAKIVSKVGSYYTIDIYADGLTTTASATGQKVAILQLNYNDTLPAGTWIMVSPSAIGTTGGGNVA